MRSKVAVMVFMVLASVVARHTRASACSTTDADTDTVDQQMFVCEGNTNPLAVNGTFDPRPSMFFAQYGRGALPTPLPGCNAPGPIPTIPAPSCQVEACPDPSAVSGTGNNQWSFYIQDDARWHLDNNEWSGNGKSDTVFYDQNQPYSKILNAAFLVWFGLKDDETVMFHGTQDYVDLSRANDSNYHSEFFRSVVDDPTYDGEYNQNFIGDDEVQSTCNDYSAVGGSQNNVVFRIGDTLHESWHAWENLYLESGGREHLTGPQGTCTIAGTDACDPFYAHTLDAFRPFGTLYQGVTVVSDCITPPRDCVREVDPNRFHSPNQVGWEFGCDLITSPADWVTQDILNDAQASQNLFLNYFIQPPPVQCGTSDPMMSPT
jgi:hypothetical protein